MNWSAATDSELLVVIYHDEQASMSQIAAAAAEYGRRHPGKQMHPILQQHIRGRAN